MIIGHQRQISYLRRVFERDTLAHAYLFHGPAGVGKRSVALACAGRLLCRRASSATGLEGCGICEDCELVARSLHPDLIVLSFDQSRAEGKNERDPSTPLRAGIGIENIHELQRRLALSPWRGGRKVVIIDQAEALSRDAQSSLLKTLEEPDAKTVFFVIAGSPDALLATVRSRCVSMRFAALGDAALALLLTTVSASQRGELVSLAEGRPGVLVQLIQDASFREECRTAAKQRARLVGMDLAARFAFAEALSRDADTMASAFVHLLRVVRGDLKRAISEVKLRRLRSLTSYQDGRIARLTAFLSILLEHLRLLETTAVNRRLVADSVLFELSSFGAEHP